jgi:hypothetical protein
VVFFEMVATKWLLCNSRILICIKARKDLGESKPGPETKPKQTFFSDDRRKREEEQEDFNRIQRPPDKASGRLLKVTKFDLY